MSPFEVCNRFAQNSWVVPELSDALIALLAEDAAHAACRMTVVNVPVLSVVEGFGADSANTVLFHEKCVELSGEKSVGAFEAKLAVPSGVGCSPTFGQTCIGAPARVTPFALKRLAADAARERRALCAYKAPGLPNDVLTNTTPRATSLGLRGREVCIGLFLLTSCAVGHG